MPVQSVLVTNGDIDHVAGLLTLPQVGTCSVKIKV